MERTLLTFACELGPAKLTELFAGSAVIADLQVMGARVALMLSDFSDQRVTFVRQLGWTLSRTLASPADHGQSLESAPAAAALPAGQRAACTGGCRLPGLVARIRADGWSVENHQFH